MLPHLTIPLEVLFILRTLQRHHFQAYLVGGAVRDLLLGNLTTQTDFDFTTNAKPEEILKLFPDSFCENEFGTVSLAPKHLARQMGRPAPKEGGAPVESGFSNPKVDVTKPTKLHASLRPARLPVQPQKTQLPNYEITTFRSDGVYSDHRRPDQVTWGTTIQDDLERRDFTINAMAINLALPVLEEVFSSETSKSSLVKLHPDQFSLLDLFNGKEDLEHHLIQTVGEAAIRFEEDALRMLRAVRFSVQLNMKLSDEIVTTIPGLAHQIGHVSFERIRDEFWKMMSSEYPAEAIELLDETGLLEHILPELRAGQGVIQGGHHTTDVWTHSLDALRFCPSKDPAVRIATLLHDVAKPATYRYKPGDSKPSFYNHEVVGARVAKRVAERLRFSKKDQDRIFTLVRWHMFHYQPQETDAAIRRFMRRVGLENLNDILDLREADRLGSGARQTSWRLEEMKERMSEQLHQPFSITDLAVSGDDIMAEFCLAPSRLIGEVLQHLFEAVMEKPELNTPDQLILMARVFLDQKLIKQDK